MSLVNSYPPTWCETCPITKGLFSHIPSNYMPIMEGGFYVLTGSAVYYLVVKGNGLLYLVAWWILVWESWSTCQYVCPIFKVFPEKLQDSLDQCPISINVDQCRSNSGIDPDVDQFRSMPINSDQFPTMPDPALIGIDRHWEELIGIDRHWSAIIGIDRGSPEIGLSWPL